jgi:hypothetical protein
MAHITGTQLVGMEGDVVAVYWFGDEQEPRQYGVCFPGVVFNIARQSLAESLALANDVLTDAIDTMESNP